MTLFETLAFITGVPVGDYTPAHAELGEAVAEAEDDLFADDPEEGVTISAEVDIEQLAELLALEAMLEKLDK